MSWQDVEDGVTQWEECDTGSVIVVDPNARSIETKDEGIIVETITNGLNFLGDGVIVSKSPTFPNQVDVTFISGVGNGIAKGDPFVVGDIMAAESDVGDGAAETIGVSATALTTHLGDLNIHFPDAPNNANQYARSGGGWAIVDQGVVTFEGRAGAVVAQPGDYDAIQIDNTPDGRITATDVQAAIKQLDDQKPEISSEDTLVDHMQIAVVATLPVTPDANTIYLVTT